MSDKVLKEKEQELSIDVEKLKDPEYVARYLREKFFYSKEDEYIIEADESQRPFKSKMRFAFKWLLKAVESVPWKSHIEKFSEKKILNLKYQDRKIEIFWRLDKRFKTSEKQTERKHKLVNERKKAWKRRPHTNAMVCVGQARKSAGWMPWH